MVCYVVWVAPCPVSRTGMRGFLRNVKLILYRANVLQWHFINFDRHESSRPCLSPLLRLRPKGIHND